MKDNEETHGLQAPIPAPEQQQQSVTMVKDASPTLPLIIAPVQMVKSHVTPPIVVTPELTVFAEQPSPVTQPTATNASASVNGGSFPPTADQYKVLTEMVKINSQLTWSDEREAYRFLTDLESLLEFSPVRSTHWISLIIMMIPGEV